MKKLDVFAAVEDDLIAREAIGFMQHGKPLLADEPGRDWLQEAYEETLDKAVYLKAEIMRREASGLMGQESPSKPGPDFDVHSAATSPWWLSRWLWWGIPGLLYALAWYVAVESWR